MTVNPRFNPSADSPMPTDAELDILAALWRLGPSTVRDVHQALEKTRGKQSAYTTTLKQMQLMTDKGLLLRSERFRSHIYQPRDPKESTQKQIAGDLLKRAFDGSAKNLMMGALAAQPASDEELAEIRRMLDQFQKGRKPR